MLVDASGILQYRQAVRPHHEVRTLEFAEWVRIGFTAEGVLDTEKIRNDCATFAPGSIVIVKASGFESDLIARALFQMRNGLFPLVRWPNVIAVVCDDPQVFQVAPPLSSTFYVQPAILNPATTKRVANQMVKESKSLRFFGRSIGALPSMLRRWSAKRRKAQERKLNRGFGWVWEE
jgi:hypothetical protein